MTYRINQPIVDVHSHFWVTTDRGYAGLDRFPRNLMTVFSEMIRSGVNVTALTDNMDDRFDAVKKSVEELPNSKRKLVDVYDNAIIINSNGSYVIFRGEEVPTEGDFDFLLMGNKRKIHMPHKRLPLKDVAQMAVDSGWYSHLPHMFDAHHGVGQAADTIKGKYDAVEWNPNCTKLIKGRRWMGKRISEFLDRRAANTKAEEYSLAFGVPLVYASDSHFPSESGRAYISLLEPLEGDNPDQLLSQIKKSVHTRNYKNGERPEGGLATRMEAAKLVFVTLYDLDFRRFFRLVDTPFEGKF